MISVLVKKIAITTLLLITLGGCYSEDDLTARELLAKADGLLENGGLTDSEPRSYAMDYYWQAYEKDPSDPLVDSHVNLGLGLIKTFNLIESFVALLDVLFPADVAEDSESAINFSPEDLYRIIEAINIGAIREIGGHYAHVAINYPDTVLFLNDTALNLDGLISLDLSGELDAGEIRLLGGLFQTLAGVLDLLFAYEGLPETLFSMLLNEEFDLGYAGDPARFFNQAPEAFPNPLLDTYFGTALEGGLLVTEAGERLALAIGLWHECFVGLAAEEDDQSNDILPNDDLVGKLLTMFGMDTSDPTISLLAGQSAMIIDLMIDLFGGLRASIVGDRVFDPNPLLGLVLSLVGGGAEIVLPGLDLNAFFSDPVLDIKDLSPSFYLEQSGDYSAGDLILETEQEDFVDENEDGTYNDGEEFTDSGVDGFVDADLDGVADLTWPTEYTTVDPNWPDDRLGRNDGRFTDKPGYRDHESNILRLPPLGHFNPVIEENDPANGVVDHVYFFWLEPSFGGLLVESVQVGNVISITEGTLRNGTLNGLISALGTMLSDISL
jgi:hypothetical protein